MDTGGSAGEPLEKIWQISEISGWLVGSPENIVVAPLRTKIRPPTHEPDPVLRMGCGAWKLHTPRLPPLRRVMAYSQREGPVI
ncbi:hypothetical protein EMCG_04740 [[Emmonsia] crescens]|uniref:Uncharacterized protein n=1 Tax=[Emmonsia] crescens TaxID=73230 RepID=A0A0G2HRC9_9EURO|nr:hypothetical protein EMCG_04740 [Emmonsia crescens UAMH 3008]